MKKSIKIWLAVSGILLIALGIVCLCNSVETLFATAWLIGLLTLLSGITTMVFTFKTQLFLPNSGSRMLSGLLQVLLGFFFLFNNAALTASLPFVFAVWVIVEGVSLAIRSFDYKRVGFAYWWVILILGVAAAVLGILGLRNPVASGYTISTLLGIAIIAFGIANLVAFFGLNKLGKAFKELMEP
ncbi:MAG: DUF308 domain-containing protein [Bacteroidales bacterium]|nr:DUF308 domain-containing protein [Bacteroidales bacterium]